MISIHGWYGIEIMGGNWCHNLNGLISSNWMDHHAMRNSKHWLCTALYHAVPTAHQSPMMMQLMLWSTSCDSQTRTNNSFTSWCRTHLQKYYSQIGSFPEVGAKIKNIWNHHLVHHWLVAILTFKNRGVWQFAKKPRLLFDCLFLKGKLPNQKRWTLKTRNPLCFSFFFFLGGGGWVGFRTHKKTELFLLCPAFFYKPNQPSPYNWLVRGVKQSQK